MRQKNGFGYLKAVLISFALLPLAWLVFSLYSLTQPMDISKHPVIPKGSTLTAAKALEKQGIELGWLDMAIIKLMGGVHYGELDIKPGRMNRYDFLVELTKARAVGIDVTLIPGETTVVFLRQAAQTLKLSQEELQKAYEKLSNETEGALYPDTYRISTTASEEQTVKTLLQASKKKHEKLCREILGECDKNRWQKLLIVASVVQKEAASDSEMPLVASVVYNRLTKKMPLQMDGTLNYGEYSHQKVTPQRIRSDDSNFNTYKRAGLPSTPVCNVGRAAIEAAANPAKTDYLYFVRNKATGQHSFSNSYNEHLQNIKK